MGSETVIQRICFKNYCGIFLRDDNKTWKVLFTYIFSVLHIVLFFVVDK